MVEACQRKTFRPRVVAAKTFRFMTPLDVECFKQSSLSTGPGFAGRLRILRDKVECFRQSSSICQKFTKEGCRRFQAVKFMTAADSAGGFGLET